LSKEEMELGHTIELFRAAPGEVLAEREAAWVAEWTPNMMVLGDPLREASHVSALTLLLCARLGDPITPGSPALAR
jgi:hypothetical protein